MKAILFGAALMSATPAAAGVVYSGPGGFEVQETVQLVVPPEQAWNAFEHVGEWWSAQHTYSGNAANMRMALSMGACLCETFEKTGGGIEHLRVVYADPNKRAVLTGSLGPLLYEATSGVMDIKVERIASGSKVTMNYRVSGFFKGGAEKMAPLVDGVLAEQMKRFRAYVTKQPRT